MSDYVPKIAEKTIVEDTGTAFGLEPGTYRIRIEKDEESTTIQLLQKPRWMLD